ncbi:Histone deacetylase hda1, partial [Ascosphaera atra]
KKEHGEFEPGSDRNHAQKSEGLAKYLWENYIEPNLATEIFFIGVGDAFLGLTSLLINNERVYLKVTGVISFVADNHVRSVASHTNAWLSKWYKDNSMVFVCSEHNMWKGQHKISKRHGKVYQSPKSNLNEMLEYHKHQVFDFIQDRIVEPVEEQENDSQ